MAALESPQTATSKPLYIANEQAAGRSVLIDSLTAYFVTIAQQNAAGMQASKHEDVLFNGKEISR